MQQQELSRLLQQGELEALFRMMGWDNPEQRSSVDVPESVLRPVPVADKRGVTAWRVDCPDGLPKRSEQHRVVRHLKRLSRDQLVVFVTPDRHLWQWPEQRPSGVGYRLVDHEYPVQAPTDALLQRLTQATFKIEEEPQLTSSSVLTRVRRSFNADKVTKSFYREFQHHHRNFTMKMEGIPAGKNCRWYASVLLNRLMFIYFIQQKRFLDNNQNYLRTRLRMVRDHYGADNFYAFYRQFLLPLFHEGLGSPNPSYDDADIETIIGTVPYVNGGIFEPHDLEKTYDIQINDEAFESLFDFFDDWRWHLDESPTGAPNEINPDILGFIFEQYINFTEAGQREQGAYYTKPDVTGYMAESAILPAVADRLSAAGLDDPAVLLAGSGDAYMRPSLGHGIDQEIPRPEGGWPWQWGDGDPARYGPDSEYTRLGNPGSDIALAGERWCDVVYRRERYKRQKALLDDPKGGWSIDRAITENLALTELLRDYMSQLTDARECQMAFDVLHTLTVCDPTVGSGAFLFAAIDMLEPLYSEVLARAEELEATGQPTPAFLASAHGHRNKRYWLIKTICLHNLFGVDLMQEAPEIAKLRLFLKLAAQIDDMEQLEPLPDLDFNIKCGNLLVGIADDGDATDRLFSQRLDHVSQLQQVENTAKQIADAFDDYIAAESADTGSLDHTGAKEKLQAKLQAARNLADTLLHEMRDETQDFEAWRRSHQPLHWFVEFPSVWRNGGFDVIIGNPPYIQTGKVTDYTWVGYKTQRCPDLYAVCVERAASLLNDRGRFAMIVMHSICFSWKFESLRTWLESSFASMWISSYWSGRMGLFTGANPRNAIVIGRARANITDPPDEELRRWATRCNRWLSESRETLFDKLEYGIVPRRLDQAAAGHQWAFADPLVVNWAGRLVESCSPLVDALKNESEHRLGYKTTALYTLPVYTIEPPTVNRVTRQPVSTSSKTTGWLMFETEAARELALLMLAGRWGYLWWLTFSDEFHVTRGTLAAFPGDVERICGLLDSPTDASSDVELVRSLLEMSSALQAEMPRNLAWMVKAGVDVGRYDISKVRYITDEADRILARLWGIEDAYEAAGNLRDRTILRNRE
ncbi:MAG: hypothetical protein F4Z34_00935 [Acidimicrobiaceae bacterium]|nr:hypothetical protein [Acidimicrobiaceae bacterium]